MSVDETREGIADRREEGRMRVEVLDVEEDRVQRTIG